jgi:hypothetical protein
MKGNFDPETSLGPISPYIFGTNYGPMHAVPLEMVPLVEGAGFTALRFVCDPMNLTKDIRAESRRGQSKRRILEYCRSRRASRPPSTRRYHRIHNGIAS